MCLLNSIMQIIRSLPISSLMPRTRLINVADYALVLALPDDVHVAVPNAENKIHVPTMPLYLLCWMMFTKPACISLRMSLL